MTAEWEINSMEINQKSDHLSNNIYLDLVSIRRRLVALEEKKKIIRQVKTEDEPEGELKAFWLGQWVNELVP